MEVGFEQGFEGRWGSVCHCAWLRQSQLYWQMESQVKKKIVTLSQQHERKEEERVADKPYVVLRVSAVVWMAGRAAK